MLSILLGTALGLALAGCARLLARGAPARSGPAPWRELRHVLNAPALGRWAP